MRRNRVFSLVVGGLALAAAAGAFAVAAGNSDSGHTAATSVSAGPTPAVRCASAADRTLADTLGAVGARIYDAERSRRGSVAIAIGSVTGSSALVRAVAAGDRAAAQVAVTNIVFNGLHIVRLRVSHNGQLLSDVGGPFVLAPIIGNLRQGGRIVGRYTLSIQDDLGYLKLAGRLAGLETVISSPKRRIMSSLSPLPAFIPPQGMLRIRGVSYLIHTLNATAFPSGPLLIYLLARRPSPPFASRSCFQIKVSALGGVAARVARRFTLSSSSYRSYIIVASGLTHSPVIVREGSRQLASSLGGAPALLPDSGTIKFRRASYGVFSFPLTTAGSRHIRIFILVR